MGNSPRQGCRWNNTPLDSHADRNGCDSAKKRAPRTAVYLVYLISQPLAGRKTVPDPSPEKHDLSVPADARTLILMYLFARRVSGDPATIPTTLANRNYTTADSLQNKTSKANNDTFSDFQ